MGTIVVTIDSKIVDILSCQLNVSKDEIKPETHLVNDLGVDSLDTIEMIISFEEAYKVSIEDTVVNEIKTVSDIVLIVENSSNDTTGKVAR